MFDTYICKFVFFALMYTNDVEIGLYALIVAEKNY